MSSEALPRSRLVTAPTSDMTGESREPSRPAWTWGVNRIVKIRTKMLAIVGLVKVRLRVLMQPLTSKPPASSVLAKAMAGTPWGARLSDGRSKQSREARETGGCRAVRQEDPAPRRTIPLNPLSQRLGSLCPQVVHRVSSGWSNGASLIIHHLQRDPESGVGFVLDHVDGQEEVAAPVAVLLFLGVDRLDRRGLQHPVGG